MKFFSYLIIGLLACSLFISTGYALSTDCFNGTLFYVWQLNDVFSCIEDRLDTLENNPPNGADSTTASNIGTSGIGIFSSEVGDDLQFKKLISSNNVTLGITSNGTNVIFVPSAGSESTVCNNLGTSGIIVCTGGNVNLRRFISANNATLSIQANSTNVIFNNLAPEATTGSNLGTSGQNIFSSEVGNDLQFKKLHTIDSCLLLTNNSTNVNADTLEDCKDKLISQMAGQVHQSITKTNIGTSFIDVYTTAFDEEEMMRIDFRNTTYFRILILWDYVGTGTHSLRWVNVTNNADVLLDTGAFITSDCGGAGIPCDTGWQIVPSWAKNTICSPSSNSCMIEWQAKSTVAGDDPIAKGYKILVK